MYIHI